MKLKNRVASVLGAVALVVGGGIATAPASQAAVGQYVAFHSNVGARGLGGCISVILANSSPSQICEGNSIAKPQNDGARVAKIRAGGGYCVTETVTIGETFIGTYNWGKSKPLNTVIIPEGARRTSSSPYSVSSDFKIYSC